MISRDNIGISAKGTDLFTNIYEFYACIHIFILTVDILTVCTDSLFFCLFCSFAVLYNKTDETTSQETPRFTLRAPIKLRGKARGQMQEFYVASCTTLTALLQHCNFSMQPAVVFVNRSSLNCWQRHINTLSDLIKM